MRDRTLRMVAHVADRDLERQLDPIMSPLVWDLGHIAAYEDLWLVHRHGGRPLLRPGLADLYDAFETPRAVRGDLALLDRREAGAYLDEVRERTLDVLAERGPDPVLHEMVVRHELQHTETMLQAMALGGLLPAQLDRLAAARARRARISSSPSCRAARCCSAPARTASPTTTSARVIPSRSTPSRSRRSGHERLVAVVRRGRRLRAA